MDLSNFTIPQLRELAQKLGIPIPARARKAEIITLLQPAAVPTGEAPAPLFTTEPGVIHVRNDWGLRVLTIYTKAAYDAMQARALQGERDLWDLVEMQGDAYGIIGPRP